MRLPDFIEANFETILTEWELFARSIWPGALPNSVVGRFASRDDAAEILRATILDMRTAQTRKQQAQKSKGIGDGSVNSAEMDNAASAHGKARAGARFELSAVVAEYRALRASVLRLWRESEPAPNLNDIDDVTRFNEAIDQSLTEAVRSFTELHEEERKTILANEQTARDAAETANRSKDVFLATLSHELRTPLNAIIGWISILRMESRVHSEANLAEGLDVIERSARTQVQLIDDVLDVSRIVSGKLRLNMSDCDLLEIIDAAIKVVRPTANARDMKLDIQLDPAARHATCDAMRMQQVVWNLLTNAIKFTPVGGTIRVVLDRARSSTRIAVSDNGPGISPEALPFIFERFRQADNTTRRSYGGLGLGLSIVKHLTEMHGGTVDAQSDGIGHGATFTVRLPIKAVRINEVDEENPSETSDDVRKSTTVASDPPPLRLDGLHVLIVDDEADARWMLSKVLESAGARITTADSATEALTVLERSGETEERPDLLVSDVGMPKQDGYDLIREVRRRGHDAKNLPAIALTAYVRPRDAREAELAGFQVHMSKPVNCYELTVVISSLTGRSLESKVDRPTAFGLGQGGIQGTPKSDLGTNQT
jgi:signal transduction histidine kinase/DNA-binding NarL/FixJ family response regulator